MPGTDIAMDRIAKTRKPTVLVNITDRRLSARSSNISSVWLDNADIGRQAARHILKCGKFRSAGYINEFGKPFYSVERMRAFREETRNCGLETDVLAGETDFHARLEEWIRKLPKPAAVMACSDRRAADAIEACRTCGICVPSEVAVVGVDNDIAEHKRCGMSISSVDNNMRLMGVRAVKELEFLFRHRLTRVREVLVPARGVIPRESTAVGDAGARLVAVATGYITKNLMRRITPCDVAKHIGCSRQLADLRFSRTKGMTVRKAIEDARMAEVQRRLDIGKSVKSIVVEMQFTSVNQLYRIYKRHFGHTIRQAGA
jgi:LacI family transcriptional regulator